MEVMPPGSFKLTELCGVVAELVYVVDISVIFCKIIVAMHIR